MVNINDSFPSKYLKAADIGKRPRRYVMEDVQTESIGSDQKLILFFKGHDKGLVLNKTNSNAIAYIYGPETDAWLGNAILLYSTMVDYQGRPVEAIRTMPPSEDEQPVRRPAPQPQQRGSTSQQAAPRRQQFDQTDEFPGDRAAPPASYDDYEA